MCGDDDDATTTAACDERGNLMRLAGGDDETTFTYDEDDRLLTRARRQGGVLHTNALVWEGDVVVTETIIDSSSDVTVERHWDADAHLVVEEARSDEGVVVDRQLLQRPLRGRLTGCAAEIAPIPRRRG